MSNKIVRPVLKRANSVKQIGNVASTYATDRIDGALNVADHYVDKYLPSEDATDSNDDNHSTVTTQLVADEKSFVCSLWFTKQRR